MRKQFTFYASFFEAARMVKNKQARCSLYDAICEYALNGVEPDLSKLPDAVAVAFVTAKPNLDASRKKAENGKQGGSKRKQTESNHEQGESEKEGENEIEIEIEKENEIEGEKEKKRGAFAPGSLFTEFFDLFPNKLGREKAWEAWRKLNPDESQVRKLMTALEAWKKSDRWKDKQGDYRFAPRAEAFLTDPGYVDAPPFLSGSPLWASGELGEADIQNIRRMMAEPAGREQDQDEINAVRRLMQNDESL